VSTSAGVVIDPGQDEGLDGPRSLLDETDAARPRTALLADADVCHALDELWPPLTAQDVVADLVATPVGDWSAADIPLLDEAAAVIGNADGAASGGAATYGHVVVDEAQELSAMAWRLVLRRCPTRSMTIVGDLAQTSDPAGASSWDHVLRPLVDDRWRLAQLTINYRTPAEVMAAAVDLFTAHHPGLRPPRSVRVTGEPPWRRRTTLAELPHVIADIAAQHTDGQLAIITPPPHLARLVAVLSLTTSPTSPPRSWC
jgi:hypothetical protein